MTKKARCETGFFYGTDIKRAASSIITQSGSHSNTISTSFMTDATIYALYIKLQNLTRYPAKMSIRSKTTHLGTVVKIEHCKHG